jgi:enoyl-CoA hydratase/carnithine racemase
VSLSKLHYERRRRVVLITMEGDNDLNLGVVGQQLHDTLREYRDDDELWCAVITGAGERAFTAGGDVKARARGELAGGGFWAARTATLLTGGEFSKPLVAAVNGYCLGAGLMLAVGCDVRIASESATFGLPEVKLGFPAGMGSTWRLPRMMASGPAMELLLTGERISARQACDWGLVNRIVPPGKQVEEALAVAERIAANPPLAVRTTKELALRGLELPFEQGLRLQDTLSHICRQTEDATEGPRAFAEKRKPEFTGR